MGEGESGGGESLPLEGLSPRLDLEDTLGEERLVPSRSSHREHGDRIGNEMLGSPWEELPYSGTDGVPLNSAVLLPVDYGGETPPEAFDEVDWVGRVVVHTGISVCAVFGLGKKWKRFISPWGGLGADSCHLYHHLTVCILLTTERGVRGRIRYARVRMCYACTYRCELGSRVRLSFAGDEFITVTSLLWGLDIMGLPSALPPQENRGLTMHPENIIPSQYLDSS